MHYIGGAYFDGLIEKKKYLHLVFKWRYPFLFLDFNYW
jgi:hypothetical protein